MIQNASFRRKVAYLLTIALLLIPLYMIGNPAKGDPSDPFSRPGGKLAQLRFEHDLAQSEIGEIDPASESMKLATLGLKGFAVAFLWHKADETKKKEKWEELVAVVNQLVKLQPNFVSVWEYQSHNLSYNISVVHDDYRFRYLWVKKGIDFLIRGTRYNRNEPKLFWTVGWYTGQKFGRADEFEQFRRLFADDQDFHAILNQHVDVDTSARGASGQPDNWLCSKLWYEKSYDMIDNGVALLRGKAAHIFFSDGPKSQMNYAIAIEGEGYLDEKAEFAWRKGSNAWVAYGDRLFPSTWGEKLRLAEAELKRETAARLKKELDELVPGAREEIYQERYAELTDEEKGIHDMDANAISTQTLYQRFSELRSRTTVSLLDIAERAPENVRAKATRLAKESISATVSAYRIDRYRENVNFVYWRTRAFTEQLPETVQAREHVFRANQLMDEVKLGEAREEFEKAWDLWGGILAKYPELIQELTEEDLAEDVDRYIELLGQFDEELPEDFVLREMLRVFGKLPGQREEMMRRYEEEMRRQRESVQEMMTELDNQARTTGQNEKEKAAEPSKEPAADPASENESNDAESTPEEATKSSQPAAEEGKADEPAREDTPAASEEPTPSSEPATETPSADSPEKPPAAEPAGTEPAENGQPERAPEPATEGDSGANPAA